MILSGAGLVNEIDRARISTSVARVGVRRFLGELLHRINWGKDDDAQPVVVFVVAYAVEQQPVLLKAQAIESVRRGATLLRVRNADDLCLRRNDTCAQPQQLGKVAAVQGKVLDLFFGAKIGNGGSFALQKLRRGLHGNGLGSSAHHQSRVGGDALADFQSHMFVNCTET